MDKSLTSLSYSFEKFRTFLLLINNENVSRIRSIIRTDIHSHTHTHKTNYLLPFGRRVLLIRGQVQHKGHFDRNYVIIARRQVAYFWHTTLKRNKNHYTWSRNGKIPNYVTISHYYNSNKVTRES
jgi:hypothetical protein